MKIVICDVCYYEHGKKREAKIRSGFRNGSKVDLCKEHRQWTKQFKNSEEMQMALFAMMTKARETKEAKP